MKSAKSLSEDYERIKNALDFLALNFRKKPNLKEAASRSNLSEYHFQRLFTRWVGISPKKFIQYLTVNSLKKSLNRSESLLSISIEAGLSSTSSLHDLFIQFEGITPGEYKQRAASICIDYEFYDSPFGTFLLASTENGICNCSFVLNGDERTAISDLSRHWPNSKIVRNRAKTEGYAKRVVSDFDMLSSTKSKLFVKGTPFQIKVWEALLRIPMGSLATYKGIALMIGMPGSARAVANAIAKNPIAFIIPCHRVICGNCAIGGYRWGLGRKAVFMGLEARRTE